MAVRLYTAAKRIRCYMEAVKAVEVYKGLRFSSIIFWDTFVCVGSLYHISQICKKPSHALEPWPAQEALIHFRKSNFNRPLQRTQ